MPVFICTGMDVSLPGTALAESPELLSHRPEWRGYLDPLAEIFSGMRVDSAGYARLEARAPWGLGFDSPSRATFGIVLRGNCWLNLAGDSNLVSLAEGDCFLLPQGRAYELRDHPFSSVRRFAEVISGEPGGVVRFGGDGAPATIVGGKFWFDAPGGQLLAGLLPSLIHIRANESETQALHLTLQLLASEIASPGPGSHAIASRLADALFMQAIRAYAAPESREKAGWVRALSDPSIGAALKAMHERIERPWTVAMLAAIAGMSRSAFAQRFRELVGEPPLEHLTRWRMYQASRVLRDNPAKLFEVASLVGYDSDSGFSKAFKRILGVTPGEYRRTHG
jgi:AraC-like DNA-binding protein